MNMSPLCPTANIWTCSWAHDEYFLLADWQTGSGAQTSMSLDEVIVSRATDLLGAGAPERSRQHQPVVERLLSDRDASRFRHAHHRRSHSEPGSSIMPGKVNPTRCKAMPWAPAARRSAITAQS